LVDENHPESNKVEEKDEDSISTHTQKPSVNTKGKKKEVEENEEYKEGST